MKIIDPLHHRAVLLEDCASTRQIEGYVAVKPILSEDWFVLYPPTGQTLPFYRLSPPIRERLKARALTHDLREACQKAAGSDPRMDEDIPAQPRSAARREAVRRWGGMCAEIAELCCRLQYGQRAVMEAWLDLYGDPEPIAENVVDLDAVLED